MTQKKPSSFSRGSADCGRCPATAAGVVDVDQISVGLVEEACHGLGKFAAVDDGGIDHQLGGIERSDRELSRCELLGQLVAQRGGGTRLAMQKDRTRRAVRRASGKRVMGNEDELVADWSVLQALPAGVAGEGVGDVHLAAIFAKSSGGAVGDRAKSDVRHASIVRHPSSPVWRESVTWFGRSRWWPTYALSMELTCAAVMFDSDGVLVDSHLDGHRAWTQLAVEFGFELSDEIFVGLAGIRPADSIARFVPADRIDEAVARLEDLEVGLASSTAPLAGAPELLNALGSESWAMVTSAGRRLAVARWAGAGIPISEVVIAAEDVALGKPHPEPYLVGAAALGVDAADCIVFEDSLSGAASAFGAGARVIAVGEQPWPTPPTARVRNLADVIISSGDDQQLTITLTFPQ